MDEYLLCDILCVIGYIQWLIIASIVIYIIKEVFYGSKTNIKDKTNNPW